jgi:tricorn protease
VGTKEIAEVDKAHNENVDVALNKKPIHDYAWSPDSRYLAYSKMDRDLVYKVYIYSLETGESHCVSDGIFNDFAPVFTRDGEHLLFISNRRFSPTFCDFEWEMVYKKVAGIYSLTLRKDGQRLLPFKSDEEDQATKKANLENRNNEGTVSRLSEVVIDFDGISDRVEPLPLPRGNYRDLAVSDSSVFYLDSDSGDFNRFEYRSPGSRTLYSFRLGKREEKKITERVDGYKLSGDGLHLIVKKGKTFAIIDADETDWKGDKRDDDEERRGEKSGDKHELDLSGLKIWLDPLEEWSQMFREAWRMERDFYYESNMHGLDWEAVGRKYERLLPRASSRQDIKYIIGELIGELNTSHTYVYGGDYRRHGERLNIGMLGADWEIDKTSNRYRLTKIYGVPDWTREVMPPLGGPGVDVRPGDYILKINGKEVTADKNIYGYFQDLAGKHVNLLVNDKPTHKGARHFVVKPLNSETTLRYLDWVEHNREIAEEMSDGQIGYIHLPDTYTGSAREFPKYFYAQTRKRGLIIDGRFNGGGLDPDIFLQRLDKELLSYWTRRYSQDQTTPAVVTRAHLVCLTNRQAGSGGDMLPWEFMVRGMGQVIGTRTWGGLVGVSMWIDLIDGGGISAPDYRIYDASGKWVVENVGVEPDITIDLHPAEMARGHDAQLMKGIEVLMDKIKQDPRPWPEHEPFPVDK